MDGLHIGKIVHYVLTDKDVETIGLRRKTSEDINGIVYYGDHVASVVTKVVSPNGVVNLKCLLDGYDDYRVTNIQFGNGIPIDNTGLLDHACGQWHWAEKA